MFLICLGFQVILIHLKRREEEGEMVILIADGLCSLLISVVVLFKQCWVYFMHLFGF